MVVSVAIPLLSHPICISVCRGTSQNCLQRRDGGVRKNQPVFLRVDSRRSFCALKTDRIFSPLKRSQYVLLTCVASEKRQQSAGGSWNFKTTAALVEHTYRSARSNLLEAEDLLVNSHSVDDESGQDQEVGCDRQTQTASTSSSWDYVNSAPKFFATSRFALLLGVVISIFGVVSLAGVAFGRWWFRLTRQGREDKSSWSGPSAVFEAPSAFSFFLKKDLKRKETVEWVNMILGKLWKVYRRGLEIWLVGLLQPLIDNLQKPSYVRRVQIQHFNLGDEPLSVRSVERRTSRRADDLQYQIGLRYTGEAKMLLSITLNSGFVPVIIPVGVRGLDVDGEIWVKLRLIPSEPWVGTATWAFVSLPKIILALAPFGLLNIMTIPFVSRFLTKLLTEDLPRLFVRPNKIVVNFLNNPAMNPFAKQFREGLNMESNEDFAGELSVTMVDARKLSYFPIGKTDPYVVLKLGNQVISSKKNSQTSIIGPPGAPIWNQDVQLLVVDPKTQKLRIRVRDIVGLGIFTVGYGEVDLSTLQDTVPTDKIVPLRGGWGLPKRFAGEILLRLTYKAYVEEDEDDEDDRPLSASDSDSESETDEFSSRQYYGNRGRIGFVKDLFSAVNTVIRDLGYENVDVQAKRSDDHRKRRPQPMVPESANINRDNNKQSRETRRRSDDHMKQPIVRESPKTNRDYDKQPNEASRRSDDRRKQPIVPESPTINRDNNKQSSEARRPPKVPSLAKGVTGTKRRIQSLTSNSAVVWLGLATGIALLTAVSLNFSNLMNP